MKYKLAFVLILVLAIFLRFWRLGSFPPGFTWDEAAIGYNAYGILTVHRDEWLTRFPLTFRSFGDYKAPLEIYLTAISEKIWGPTVYAVRFPTALAGVGLVIGGYLLTKELLRREKHVDLAALMTMFLVAISPWALHFSSIAFESMLGVCLGTFGTIFFLKGMRGRKFMVLSGICYALSLYAYHSPKLVIPLTILLLLFLHRKALKPLWSNFVIFLVTCLVIGAPLASASLFGKASSRFTGSTVVLDAQQRLKPVPQVVSILVTNFVTHLTPKYLFLGGETTYRQSNMQDGILSPLEGILVVVALLTCLFSSSQRKLASIILILIAISILPATLGADVPHANRALMGLPWFQVLASSGFIQLLELRNRNLRRGLLFALPILAVGGLVWHLQNDVKVYATSEALTDLQFGYQQAVSYARSQEPTVDKVYFTNHYGQAYIFLLFFKHMSPIEYRGGGLANYVITDHPFNDARGRANVLIIGTPQDVPSTVGIEKEIKFPDGKVAFRITRQ